MKIHNIRLGFATNSSSSHSMIFDPNIKVADDMDGDDGFGWSFFTAASPEAKASYMTSTLYSNLSRCFPKPLIDVIINGLKLPHVQTSDYGTPVAGIDHQSLYTLPVDFGYDTPSIEFFNEFNDYVMREGVIILGGNDNDEREHYLANEGTKLEFGGWYPEGEKFTCRKDGEWWTLYSPNTGNRITLSFADNPQPYKPLTPLLMDVKVTDYCDHGCAYCYQGSTKHGEHMKSNDMYSYAKMIAEAGVFEVACLSGDTLVISDKGYVALQNLYIGDKLLTSDYQYKRVVQISSQMRECISLEGTDGFYVKCTPDHPFIVNGKVVEARNLLNVKLDQLQPTETGVTVTAINNIGVHHVYDVTLEADSTHIYCLATGTVLTHNCGGGEPTQFPQFEPFLHYLKADGVVVNFTTKSTDWLEDEARATTLLGLIGAFAYSADASSYSTVKRIHTIFEYRKYDLRKFTLQIIPATMNQYELEQLLTLAHDLDIRVTLLGYKDTGRGAKFKEITINRSWNKFDESQWLQVLTKLNGENRLGKISIDTTMASKYKQQLETSGIPEWLYHIEEGKYSMYMDMVANTYGPSSYHLDKLQPIGNIYRADMEAMFAGIEPV